VEELVKCPILRGGGGSSRELFTLQHLVTQHRGFIAGGYARWAMSPLQSPAPPSDIDCYFRDLDGMQAFSYAITRSGWRIVRSNAFAVKFTKAYFDLPLHAVCVTGTPGFIVEGMDFGICQAIIDHCEGRATYSYMEEESRKVLKVKKPHNLLLTLKRVEKYKGRGYSFAEEELDYLFSFFAVRPLSPGESPFANYRILSANPSNVEIPEQPMLTQGPRPSWGVEPLFPVPRGWTAPDRNPRPPLARTRGDITFEELALMQLGPPNRRAPTEEEIADARLQAAEDRAVWGQLREELESFPQVRDAL
jgi:hypothetical protein